MRVYVGTYAKYNSGSIAGKWLDLEDYSDKAEFHEACAELHKDEADPEFMFQDWEGIPKGMISESHIDDEAFELAAMDEDDRELLTVYREHINQEGDLDAARDAFHGKHDSERDFAETFWDETGELEGLPDHLTRYIDWEAVARDMRLGGDFSFVRIDGDVWVFSGN
jgi:antirestriction protein